MEKTITFNIPEGYVIDKENSTDTNIVLKLNTVKLVDPSKPKTWEEYCEKTKGKISYYMDPSSGITISIFGNCPFLSEFETEEEVKAFEIYSKLIKLRKQWIGEWKPDWIDSTHLKYVIHTVKNKVTSDAYTNFSYSMSFPTPEMRDEFFDCFKDLLEQAKDLI